MGAENTVTGPQPSFSLISFICLTILMIPLPSESRRLPPNLATETVLKAHSTYKN